MSKLHNYKILKPIRRELRHNLTKAEVLLWMQLKNSQLGFKFRRQHSIKNYVVDFFCPTVDLVIELDGETHGEESRIIRDREMEEFLKNKGFTIIRFTNEQLFSNLGYAVSEIKNLCVRLSKRGTTPTPPWKGGDQD